MCHFTECHSCRRQTDQIPVTRSLTPDAINLFYKWRCMYLDQFSTGDLAHIIPFLPPSEFVPSALFSATREDLNAVVLVQIATTCKDQSSQTPALRWLFEPSSNGLTPSIQFLTTTHLISSLILARPTSFPPWNRGFSWC